MTLTLDFPECTQSPLGRWDPRWKLAGVLLMVFAAALVRTLPAALVVFAGALILVLLARLPLRWYCRRLVVVAVFLAVFLVWLPFLYPAPTLNVLGIELSEEGTRLALTLLLKAAAIVSLFLALMASAPLPQTLRAAQALRCPRLFLHLTLLTYRYVFLLAEEVVRLRSALRVRGYRNRATAHCYRTVGQATGSLLVRSQERAERVDQAMRCRGFDGVFRTLHLFQTRFGDAAGFLMLVGCTAAVVVWDFVLRSV
ncbi:MAG: cobalt ECF transporter T component CbiQ [Gemmataceae bacterium]|nr:cobalt ECF transporter T component CbiQ [Gemmataceae bacterium]